LSSINAGAVVLVGQLTDAVATAAIGVLSDNVNVYCTDRYGRRKTWHLFGKQIARRGRAKVLPTNLPCDQPSCTPNQWRADRYFSMWGEF
jgi:hypothetical protein